MGQTYSPTGDLKEGVNHAGKSTKKRLADTRKPTPPKTEAAFNPERTNDGNPTGGGGGNRG